MSEKGHVFISYAREDHSWAERLYLDLRKHEVDAWLDVRCLAVGANWKIEIERAIRGSRYFILLVSRHSVNKRGFVQKELKQAIDVLQELPTGEIFVIPARLDATEPIDQELRELHWVELLPNYHSGFERILSSLKNSQPAPLVIAEGRQHPGIPGTFIDKGSEVTLEVPVLIGPRAAVSYAPFRTKREFLQQFFDRLPSDSIFTDRTLSYYISIDTRHPRVQLGDDLKEKFPEFITVVLQNSFRDLQVREEGVSVVLTFGGAERTMAFPYEAVVRVAVPEIGVTIAIEPERRSESAPPSAVSPE